MLLLLSSGVWRVWKWSHRGGWRYGALGREELSRSSAKKEHWAKSGRPCSGKTPWTPRDPRLEGDVARFTHTGATARPRHLQHSGFLMKWQTKGFLVKQRLEESGPKAPLFTKQTKPDNLVFTGWTPQFAAVMKLLPSAEVNVSRAEAALLANRRGHPVPPTVLPKHKGHSQGTTPHQTP